MSRPRCRERELMGLASVPGRQALPTQACHLPQAGEGVLQAAALLRTGPTAPQRLLHLGLVHVQQGVQRELSEDLLRKHRGTGREPVSTQAPPTPSSHSPWPGPASPLSGRGQLLVGPPPTRGHHLSEGSGSQLTPQPQTLRRQQLK